MSREPIYYRVLEQFRTQNLNLRYSCVVDLFRTESDAREFIDGIKDGSVDESMIVENPDNLFIETVFIEDLYY